MCKCYVVTANIRFIQYGETDAEEAKRKAKNTLDKLPAVTVNSIEVKPFGK